MPVVARCTNCGEPIPRLRDDWCAGCAESGEKHAAHIFYDKASWPVGTLVENPDDPDVHGTLVRRAARLWVDRDRKPPLVRWHGKIDAESIDWRRLARAR